jgi:tRNA G46 methylase TrmB
MEAPQQEGKSQRTRRLNDELHALVRQRNLKACLAALAQGERDKNVDGRSYATACAACGDAGDGQTALRLLRTAGRRGGKCAPGVEACTAAVKALGSNDVDAAYSLVEAMSRAGSSHAPHECGPLTEIAKPNQRTLNTLLRACLTAGRLDVAKRALTLVEPDASSKSYVASMYCAALDPANARKVLGEDADASSLVAVAAAEALLGETKCTETARQALTVVGRHTTQGIRDDARRQASNEAFRRHRDEEARREASVIDVVPASRTVAALKRVLCCSRSEVLSGVERRDALTLRFGLDEALWASQRFQEPGDGRGAKKKRRDKVRVARDAIASDSRFSPPIDMKELVDGATSIVVELGSGSGEWAAAKASHDPSTVLLAVESRCDRAASILKRAVLDDANNLCVAHGDASSVLRALRPGSVACIHANFPEPPSQTCVETDMPHMLSEECFQSAAIALKPGGRFVVVSDNEAFSRFLVADVHEAFDTVRLPYREVTNGLYVGAPCEEIGWPSQGDSYFDRLWRRGVSRHSATQDRYVMCWERNNVAVGAVPERPVGVVVVEKKRKSSKGLKNLLKKKRKRRRKQASE